MDIFVRPFRYSDQDAVITLWKICDLVIPANDPVKDIERKMKVNPELFLVGELEGTIVATVMAGYEGHRGWLNYLAVHPDHRKSGFGAQILQHAEELLIKAGCPKINLQVRASNSGVIAFYEKLGFGKEKILSMAKRLEDDSK